jgi:hypothetical protein
MVKLIGAIILSAIVLFAAWCWTHPRANDATSLAECRQYYVGAHTAADTSRVDGIVPERSGRAQTAMTCGALRRAYPQ